MKSKNASVAAAAASVCMVAFGFVEPIYTVTTSGEGTNSLDSAMVQVTQGGETSEAPFSGLSLAGGTFVKRGTGWLQSSDAMASFTGELVIEAGAFIVSRTGQSGKINAGTDQYKTEWTGCARVVVSNGATLTIDNATEYPTLKQPIYICGDGYKGFGAICNFNGRSGSNGSQLYYSQVTLAGDATICHGCDGGRLGLGYSVLDMNGHTLTSKSLEGRGVHVMGGVQVTNPGHIVFDSTLAHFSLNKKWDGTAANTVTFTNNAYLRMQGFGSDVKWTAINACEPLGADAYDSNSDTWDKPNANRWNGPFRLDKPMTVGYNARPTHCLSLGGTVSGEAGLTVKDHWLRLRAKNNTFKGGVNVGNGGHLVLYGNGSLPANGGTVTVANGGEVLFDDTVATEEARLATMEYPSFDWSVASDETKTFPQMYVTNTVAAGLVKRGSGVLELKGPVSVTGVVELAGGTLRLPFEQAGLCEGWVPKSGSYGTYENGAKMLGKLECITTNRVAFGTELAYTTNAVLWQRSTLQDWSYLLSYHGYIWNRTGADATWVFAQAMWKGTYLYIGGERVIGYTRPGVVSGSEAEPKNFYYRSGDALSKCVAFYTVIVPPGAHRIDLRTYTSTGSNSWGPCCITPTNATWKAKFGWGLDMNGTMSTNCADYAELLDPGDGSLLTVTTNGMDATLAALVPSFAHLKFSGGTLDAYGSDVRVPVLEGANGTITNSNAFAANGVVAVGEKWILQGSGYSGGRLMVCGKLKFAEGARFELEDPELLSRRGRYVIAEATGGIHGVPERVLSGGEATHWRLAVGSGESGNDTLELFWSMGFTISFR